GLQPAAAAGGASALGISEALAAHFGAPGDSPATVGTRERRPRSGTARHPGTRAAGATPVAPAGVPGSHRPGGAARALGSLVLLRRGRLCLGLRQSTGFGGWAARRTQCHRL